MDNWYDKEQRYYDAFDAGKVSKDIWKYIPKKYYPAVTNAFADSDGYWVWLDNENGGWRAYDGDEDCGMIHEYTIEDLKNAIKTIKKYK